MRKTIIAGMVLCSLLAGMVQPVIAKDRQCWNRETLCPVTEQVEKKELQSKSYVLMEGKTGTVLCQRNMNKELMPASITKIMTILLIYEAIDEKQIALDDVVRISSHAAGKGGSQVFLEEGEEQTVESLLKCIVIASANDAATAMAEYIAGSEEAFVKKMNQRARELNMKHTQFSNCCGLDDTLTSSQHYSCAYDIALMSRALIMNYPEVEKYTTTWMDEITHVTKRGETAFGLTNTNKLVRTYNGINGLKTGSTSKAKFCLSATAKRDQLQLIAVVMCAPDPNVRFQEAATLLDYGFANCTVYQDDNKNCRKVLEVAKGKCDTVSVEPKEEFSYVCVNGQQPDNIEKKIKWNTPLYAPIQKGQEVGRIWYYYKNKKIGTIPIIAKDNVEKAKYIDYVKTLIQDVWLVA